ncbi:hypothetical protein FSO04_18855 [Paraburkholderia madseniana]|uniref:Uncharacterized protein n=1 Tax=Paraburkholderia madseniana TaxID=2599607 RepID=A0A6N6WD97_9BURK|nr:hypothetical protein [Paraburkholderia madseniana]KAE8758446.1 hypothetical protein FSO04_18855 [Paraburkholderia madseniana]
MKILSSSNRQDLALAAFLESRATFDASDRDQRMLVRLLVIPMLTRKLDFPHIALQADPQSESIRAMCASMAQAVRNACAKLDGPLGSQACMADLNARITMALEAIAALPPRKPGRKKTAQLKQEEALDRRAPARLEVTTNAGAGHQGQITSS